MSRIEPPDLFTFGRGSEEERDKEFLCRQQAVNRGRPHAPGDKTAQQRKRQCVPRMPFHPTSRTGLLRGNAQPSLGLVGSQRLMCIAIHTSAPARISVATPITAAAPAAPSDAASHK